MVSRLLIILAGVPLVFLAITAGDIPRFLLFGLVSVLGQAELFRLLSPTPVLPHLEATAGLVLLFSASLMGERGLLIGLGIAMVILASHVVLRGFDGKGYQRFALGTVSLVYIPFSLAFLLLLAQTRGAMALFGILIAVWALDIGAYAFGMSLRGPALAPRISPNKTISGAIGGSLATFCAVWIMGIYGIFPSNGTRLALLAGAIAIFGQIADLFESVFKREAGCKDSGNLLGAHGGILDRVDSLLLLGPVVFFILTT